MSDFDDYPFSLPQNWGKRMEFLKFFFTSEDKILETTSLQVFTTINTLASGCFQGFSEKKTPKRTWLCAGISLVWYALQTW